MRILKNSGVKNLEGLEYAENVIDFYLEESEDIKDFSTLEKLHKIEQVDIRTKSLNDDTVPVLDSHPNLKSLAYQDSLITEKSFEKIIKSSTIRSMQLNSNPNIKFFGVLTQMSNLEYLMMQFTGVSDFRPVSDFAKLETIFAHGQKTVDTPIELKLSDLIWNEEQGTLTIKNELIDRALINHNRKTYEPNATNRYIAVNGSYLSVPERETDFVVSGVTPQNYSEIKGFNLSARFDVGDDETVGPAGFTKYVMSNIGYTKEISIIQDELEFEVEYRDGNGQIIKTSTQENGTLLQEYTLSVPVIPVYSFKNSSEPLPGRFRMDQFTKMTLFYDKDLTTKHTVSFDSMGGTPVSPISDILSGTRITAPTQPTRTGYDFVAWTNNDVVWDFDTMSVNQDIILVAKWTERDVQPTEVLPPSVEERPQIVIPPAPEESETLPETGVAASLNFGLSLILAGTFTLLFKKKSE